MAHLLVVVPVRISISYLQATVHIVNLWISGFCCELSMFVLADLSILEGAKPLRAL